MRLARVVGVVDDQRVGPLAGRRAAHRGGDAVAARRGLHLVLLVLVSRQAHAGEEAPVPGAGQHQAEVKGVADAEPAAVARCHDAGRRIVAHQPGRPRHRDADRFQVPGRQVDDQPGDLAARAGRQVLADQMDVPVVEITRDRVRGLEDLGGEARQVLAQDGIEQPRLVDGGAVWWVDARRVDRGAVGRIDARVGAGRGARRAGRLSAPGCAA